MADQASIMKKTMEMNESPLQQHVMGLLLSEGRDADQTTLYVTEVAMLIPELVTLDMSRPLHQRLVRFLKELPILHPDLQMAAIMGQHQSWTEDDIEEMVDEMKSMKELDDLALLMADNLLGVLNRE